MRVVIPVTGSRGDVQPFIALGRGAQAAGHEVCVATHPDFAPLVRDHGLRFFPLSGHSRAVHSGDAARRMANAGRNPFAYFRNYVRLREPLLRSNMAECATACRGADLVLLTPTSLLVALSAAEKCGASVCITSFLPSVPSRHWANCFFPEAPRWCPGRTTYNTLTHLLAGGCLWALLGPRINQSRRELLDLPPYPRLGLPPSFFKETPTLLGFSPRVVPRPPDWGNNIHVSGYWFLDAAQSWRPPAGLRAFLESGPPPLCIGFGSMNNGDAERATEVVCRAVAASGQRAVLLTGWGALATPVASDRVFVADDVPHDWLFPRAAAVIHHGGAGATSAGLRAGVPSLAVPFAGDQFFWGRRLFALGVGPRPIPRRELSVPRLTAALRAMIGDSGMRRRAAALGAAIRAEDGVGSALSFLDREFPRAQAPSARAYDWPGRNERSLVPRR